MLTVCSRGANSDWQCTGVFLYVIRKSNITLHAPVLLF